MEIKDNMQRLLLFFYLVSPRDAIQVFGTV